MLDVGIGWPMDGLLLPPQEFLKELSLVFEALSFEPEDVQWMFLITELEWLGGQTPLQALAEGRSTHVKLLAEVFNYRYSTLEAGTVVHLRTGPGQGQRSDAMGSPSSSPGTTHGGLRRAGTGSYWQFNKRARQENQACIEACRDCANACDDCATACLKELDAEMMERCIALDVDCAAICRLALGYMARDSDLAGQVCMLCAQVCKACGSECGKLPHDHCKRCAEACRQCAEACERMAA